MNTFHLFLLQDFSEAMSPRISIVCIFCQSFLRSSLLARKQMYEAKGTSLVCHQDKYTDSVTV